MLAPILAVLLVVLAAVPLVLPLFAAQPDDVAVQQIFDGEVVEPGRWVRLSGRVFPLADSPTGEDGSTLCWSMRRTRCARSWCETAAELEPQESATRHRSPPGARRQRRGGAADRGHRGRHATADRSRPRPRARRHAAGTAVRAWPLSILPALLAALLLVGVRVGLPDLPPAVVDVLAGPLGPGERLPAAYGGRVGPNERDLADPGAALLLVRRGPRGNLLTAQPLSDGGGRRRRRSRSAAVDDRRDRRRPHREGVRAGARRPLGAGGRDVPVRPNRGTRSRRGAGRRRPLTPTAAQVSCITTIVAT